MKRWIKKKMAWFLCTALVLAGMEGLGGWQCFGRPIYAAAADDMAKGVNVQYHTQDEIRTYIANSGATVNDALTFAEDPVTEAPYSLGKLSQETLESAVAMVNQIRYIAGISNQVQLSEEYNELTQAASLANYVNDQLSHYPVQPDGMSDAMYGLAAEGASSSNIAWASWANRSLNSTLVSSWMNDGDSSNIDRVGHRRWIINPTMGKTGFGAVSGKNGTYSAVYSFDRSNSAAQEYGVMWPAQNMPVEYFGTSYPWSISMGYAVNASDIQVALTRESDGESWIFSQASSDGEFYVNNDGYGQKGCIIFRPGTGIDKYNAGEVFRVEITGLAQGDVSYTVNFFSLASDSIVTPVPTESSIPTISPVPTETPTATPVLTPGPSVTPTAEPTASPTAEPTASPTAAPTASPTPTISPVPTETPTATPVVTPSPVASPTATPIITPGPAVTLTPDPTVAPTAKPDQTSTPTLKPTATPGSDVENNDNNTNTAKDLKKGSKVTDKKTMAVYKVTGTGSSKTVEYVNSTNKSVASVTVPATVKLQGKTYKVTSIGKSAFQNSKKLKTVKIGKNVTTINKQAFSGCKKLTNVTIGKNVTTIGASAFSKCTALTVITIPGRVQKIGAKAFYQCKKLQHFIVKTNKLTLKNVGKNAFGGGYSSPRISADKKMWKGYLTIFVSRGMSKKVVFVVF